MEPLLSRQRLPPVSRSVLTADDPDMPVIPEDLPHSLADRFGKLFRVATGTVVALVATFGWLYLMASSVRAFVSWL